MHGIHFLFCAPLNVKHYHPQNLICISLFYEIMQIFGISLHKLLGAACYLWFPKVTLHLNIYDSLLGVVFGTTVVIYLVLPLNTYMQMVQNVCF